MEKNPTFLIVVAADIRDEAGRLLLQQRPPHKHHSGFWEFPGGKVEDHEIPRFSLVREITEELGLDLDYGPMEPAGFADEPANSGSPALVLILYTCPRWSGDPAGLDGQQWGWFTRAEAEQLALAPMDRRLLAGLADGEV